MKIAISTCQTGMIESLSTMFSEHEWHVLGIMRATPDWPFNMAINTMQWPYRKNVFNHFQDEEPIGKLNIRKYDLLIDVAESNDYNPRWQKTAINWDIPRIFYNTNPAPKTSIIRRLEKRRFKRFSLWAFRKFNQVNEPIFHYYRRLGDWPRIYTNETLRRDWGLKGEVIHFSHDEWGIGGWIGDEPTMLYGKNGYYSWAPPTREYRKFFDPIQDALGEQFEIRDPWRDTFLPEDEWRDYVRHKRIWFEFDFGSTGRALTQGLAKAMCLGLPVVLWKTNICQGWRFVKNQHTGLVTDNVDEVVTFAKQLFYDKYLAKAYSENMVRTYKKNLSWAVAKPKWEKAMKRAGEEYECK